MANIQIPEELFVKLYKFHSGLDQSEANAAAIRAGLEAKLDAAMRRSYYGDMHNKALSPEDRERARQAYLDAVGVPESFRR